MVFFLASTNKFFRTMPKYSRFFLFNYHQMWYWQSIFPPRLLLRDLSCIFKEFHFSTDVSRFLQESVALTIFSRERFFTEQLFDDDAKNTKTSSGTIQTIPHPIDELQGQYSVSTRPPIHQRRACDNNTRGHR